MILGSGQQGAPNPNPNLKFRQGGVSAKTQQIFLFVRKSGRGTVLHFAMLQREEKQEEFTIEDKG